MFLKWIEELELLPPEPESNVLLEWPLIIRRTLINETTQLYAPDSVWSTGSNKRSNSQEEKKELPQSSRVSHRSGSVDLAKGINISASSSAPSHSFESITQPGIKSAGLSLTKTQKPFDFLTSFTHVNFTMELIGQAMTLPLEDIATMRSAVAIYASWLLESDTRPVYFRLPKNANDPDEQWLMQTIFKHLSNIFHPRSVSNGHIVSLPNSVSGISAGSAVHISGTTASSTPPTPAYSANATSTITVDLHASAGFPVNTCAAVPGPHISLAEYHEYCRGYSELCQQVLKVINMAVRSLSGSFTEITWSLLLKVLLGSVDSLLREPQVGMLYLVPGLENAWLAQELSEPLIRLLMETWLRSKCNSAYLWDRLKQLFVQWRHRSEVIQQWSHTAFGLTNRIIRLTYGRGQGTELVTISINGYNVSLQLPDDFVVYAWHQVMHLIGAINGLKSLNFRLAIEGVSRMVAAWKSVGYQLDALSLQASELSPYSCYASVDINTVLHIFGDWLFNAATVVPSESNSASSATLLPADFRKGRAEAFSILCLLFSDTRLFRSQVLPEYWLNFRSCICFGLEKSGCTEAIYAIITSSVDLFTSWMPELRKISPIYVGAIAKYVLPRTALPNSPAGSQTAAVDEVRHAAYRIISCSQRVCVDSTLSYNRETALANYIFSLFKNPERSFSACIVAPAVLVETNVLNLRLAIRILVQRVFSDHIQCPELPDLAVHVLLSRFCSSKSGQQTPILILLAALEALEQLHCFSKTISSGTVTDLVRILCEFISWLQANDSACVHLHLQLKIISCITLWVRSDSSTVIPFSDTETLVKAFANCNSYALSVIESVARWKAPVPVKPVPLQQFQTLPFCYSEMLDGAIAQTLNDLLAAKKTTVANPAAAKAQTTPVSSTNLSSTVGKTAAPYTATSSNESLSLLVSGVPQYFNTLFGFEQHLQQLVLPEIWYKPPFTSVISSEVLWAASWRASLLKISTELLFAQLFNRLDFLPPTKVESEPSNDLRSCKWSFFALDGRSVFGIADLHGTDSSLNVPKTRILSLDFSGLERWETSLQYPKSSGADLAPSDSDPLSTEPIGEQSWKTAITITSFADEAGMSNIQEEENTDDMDDPLFNTLCEYASKHSEMDSIRISFPRAEKKVWAPGRREYASRQAVLGMVVSDPLDAARLLPLRNLAPETVFEFDNIPTKRQVSVCVFYADEDISNDTLSLFLPSAEKTDGDFMQFLQSLGCFVEASNHCGFSVLPKDRKQEHACKTFPYYASSSCEVAFLCPLLFPHLQRDTVSSEGQVLVLPDQLPLCYYQRLQTSLLLLYTASERFKERQTALQQQSQTSRVSSSATEKQGVQATSGSAKEETPAATLRLHGNSVTGSFGVGFPTNAAVSANTGSFGGRDSAPSTVSVSNSSSLPTAVKDNAGGGGSPFVSNQFPYASEGSTLNAQVAISGNAQLHSTGQPHGAVGSSSYAMGASNLWKLPLVALMQLYHGGASGNETSGLLGHTSVASPITAASLTSANVSIVSGPLSTSNVLLLASYHHHNHGHIFGSLKAAQQPSSDKFRPISYEKLSAVERERLSLIYNSSKSNSVAILWLKDGQDAILVSRKIAGMYEYMDSIHRERSKLRIILCVTSIPDSDALYSLRLVRLPGTLDAKTSTESDKIASVLEEDFGAFGPLTDGCIIPRHSLGRLCLETILSEHRYDGKESFNAVSKLLPPVSLMTNYLASYSPAPGLSRSTTAISSPVSAIDENKFLALLSSQQTPSPVEIAHLLSSVTSLAVLPLIERQNLIYKVLEENLPETVSLSTMYKSILELQ